MEHGSEHILHRAVFPLVSFLLQQQEKCDFFIAKGFFM